MKSTGIVRSIDELGRIVIPKEYRTMQGIADKDPVEMTLEGDAVIIRKYSKVCLLCSGDGELTEFKGKSICYDCIAKIKNEL